MKAIYENNYTHVLELNYLIKGHDCSFLKAQPCLDIYGVNERATRTQQPEYCNWMNKGKKLY